MASEPSDDLSIAGEPHLRDGSLTPDDSEARAARTLAREARQRHRTDEIEHSVWDEPAMAGMGVAQVAPGEEYATWLAERRMRTGALASWLVVLATTLAAGPMAVVGVLLGSSNSTAYGLIASILIGPVAEEVMKNALALYVVEKRPYLFRSRLQIALCALSSGVAFAAIENLLYLRVYVPSPAPELISWRWTVCVALHAGCALIYALGLMRIWADVWRRRTRPRLALGLQYAVVAMLLHAAYNGVVTALALGGVGF